MMQVNEIAWNDSNDGGGGGSSIHKTGDLEGEAKKPLGADWECDIEKKTQILNLR